MRTQRTIVALSLLAVCVVSEARNCRVENFFGGRDLLKNVTASVAAGAAITAATGSSTWGIAATSTFAVLKEVSDIHRTYHVCSLSDMAQMIAGSVAGSVGMKLLIMPDTRGGVSLVYATEF